MFVQQLDDFALVSNVDFVGQRVGNDTASKTGPGSIVAVLGFGKRYYDRGTDRGQERLGDDGGVVPGGTQRSRHAVKLHDVIEADQVQDRRIRPSRTMGSTATRTRRRGSVMT
jgi:hypothetical protein